MSGKKKELSVLFAGGGTAGHLLPALAIESALRARLAAIPGSELTTYFLATSNGAERRILEERGAAYRIVPKTDFPRTVGIRALTFIPRLLVAVSRTLPLARRANVIVGFGGYVALPAYIAASILRKPLVIHEANAVPGLANRLGRFLATHTLTNFPIPKWRDSRAVGLPIRDEIWRIGVMNKDERALAQSSARKHLHLEVNRKTLLVFGGSLGAAKLNSALADALDELLGRGFQVLHGTGPEKGNHLQHKRPAYHPVAYISEMDQAYLAADVVIARSGAGTCAEISATGIPALLVPLAIGNGEQIKNAAQLLERGNVQLIENEKLTAARLVDAVVDLSEREIISHHENRSAAEVVAEIIIKSSIKSGENRGEII